MTQFGLIGGHLNVNSDQGVSVDDVENWFPACEWDGSVPWIQAIQAVE